MIAYTTLFSSKGEGAARCLCQDTRSHNKVYCRGYDQPQGRVSDRQDFPLDVGRLGYQ